MPAQRGMAIPGPLGVLSAVRTMVGPGTANHGPGTSCRYKDKVKTKQDKVKVQEEEECMYLYVSNRVILAKFKK